MASPSGRYPVAYDVEPPLHDRNRLTVFFRIILAIPHLVLVGGPGFAIGSGGWLWHAGGHAHGVWGFGWGSHGILGAAAGLMAFIAWFAILFTGSYPERSLPFRRRVFALVAAGRIVPAAHA